MAKDCGDVLRFASLEEMTSYLEAIDVENDEYSAWDSAGNALEFTVNQSSRKQWLRIRETGVRISDEELLGIRTKAEGAKS